MPANTQMLHSGCPKKVNINPGIFRLQHTFRLEKVDLEEWVCELCHDEVLLSVPKVVNG